jgi:mono/diheme cytochrome c family protein
MQLQGGNMPHNLLKAVFASVALLGASNTSLISNPPPVDEIPASYTPSGKAMFTQYCASCHGLEGTGDGPAAFTLKRPPSDLSKLTATHMGEFPRQYVMNILRFGPGLSAHGSSDMPTWGSIFQVIEKNNETAVQQRISKLTAYIASLQKK